MAERLNSLLQIQARLVAETPALRRPCFAQLNSQARAQLLLGPRGLGKTTFLLLKAKAEPGWLYLSADNPIVASSTLWEIANDAFVEGFTGLLIDEVHFAKDWSQQLKAIYDAFPKKSLWASDSSSIVLRGGLADLSRRFLKVSLPFLSFREYLYLKTQKEFSVIDPFKSVLSDVQTMLDSAPIMRLFREYTREGLRPIFLEGHYVERLINIIEKTIFSDVPYLVPQIQEHHFRLMNAVIGLLAQSTSPTLNLDGLSKTWSIGKEKLYKLLFALEMTGLIRIIRYPKDKKAMTKGAKIFLSDPSMYFALGGNLGNQREALVATLCLEVGLSVFASKDESSCDFIIDGKMIEVGGKNKKAKKSDYVIRDDIDLPGGRAIPLWMMGMMY